MSLNYAIILKMTAKFLLDWAVFKNGHIKRMKLIKKNMCSSNRKTDKIKEKVHI